MTDIDHLKLNISTEILIPMQNRMIYNTKAALVYTFP